MRYGLCLKDVSCSPQYLKNQYHYSALPLLKEHQEASIAASEFLGRSSLQL